MTVYVIEFNFAQVYRNGPSLFALKYLTLKVVKNMTVFMPLILILRRFTEVSLHTIFKFPTLKYITLKVVKNMTVFMY